MTIPTSNNNELLVEENSSLEGLPNIRDPKLQSGSTSNSNSTTAANNDTTKENCMNDRTKGLLVMMIGVLVISPDAVLTHFLSNGGSQPWTIIFWKMVFAVPVALGFAVYDAGGISKLSHQIQYGKYYYPIVVPLQAAVDTCFTLAFVYTSAAKALLLINLNPLWCALAGRFLLGDVLPTRTYLALGLAFLCTLVIFVPELVQRSNSQEETTMSEFDEGIEDIPFVENDGALLGNVIALFTGLGLAAYITLVRHASTQNSPPVHLIGCTPLAAMLAAVVALIVRKGDVLPESYWRIDTNEELSTTEMNNNNHQYWQFWLASVAQGIAIGVIFICITIAPRLITGAEVGLCVLLEAVLGPLFVFLAYGDVPSLWTILGGSLLLVVLAVHEATPLFHKAHKTIRQSIQNRRTRRSQCLKEEQHHQHDLPLEVTITKPSNSTVEVESGESE